MSAERRTIALEERQGRESCGMPCGFPLAPVALFSCTLRDGTGSWGLIFRRNCGLMEAWCVRARPAPRRTCSAPDCALLQGAPSPCPTRTTHTARFRRPARMCQTHTQHTPHETVLLQTPHAQQYTRTESVRYSPQETSCVSDMVRTVLGEHCRLLKTWRLDKRHTSRQNLARQQDSNLGFGSIIYPPSTHVYHLVHIQPAWV